MRRITEQVNAEDRWMLEKMYRNAGSSHVETSRITPMERYNLGVPAKPGENGRFERPSRTRSSIAGLHVFTVFAHLNRDSLAGAILDRFVAGLEAGGHSVDISDLYREDFDPLFRSQDFAYFRERGPMPSGISDIHARIEPADVLAFVYPVWWWSVPAIELQIDTGIWIYCGLTDVETHLMPDVDASSQARERHLAHAEEIGRNVQR
jgi:putative NADPH-quinone reductase